ncbi:MAG: anti-sigma factor family protein [Bacillota bacterium]
MHFNEGLLQAYIDGETSDDQRGIITEHLKECPMCREKLEELQSLDGFVGENIKIYQTNTDEMSINATPRYISFQKRAKEYKWKGWKNKMFNYRKIAAGFAAVIIFASTVFVPPVRQAAADFLHIFRVQKIETIQLDVNDFNQMRNNFMNKVGEIDLKQLGKANIVNQPKYELMPLSKAQQRIPFALKYPANLVSEQTDVNVVDKSSIEFTLDVGQVNKILKQLGSPRLLPEGLDNETFSVYSRGQVDLTYRIDDNQWLSLQQVASPELSVPNGVDIGELRQVLLDIPILPYDLKQKLEAVNDWQHTLIVPTDEQSIIVNVNGEKGILRKYERSSHLLWQEKGVLYNLMGTAQMDLVEIANNLRDVK